MHFYAFTYNNAFHLKRVKRIILIIEYYLFIVIILMNDFRRANKFLGPIYLINHSANGLSLLQQIRCMER